MKTIILILAICGSAAYGQNKEGRENFYLLSEFKKSGSFRISDTPVRSGTLIYIDISPAMPDSINVSDEELFVAMLGWNSLRYDIQVAQIRKGYCRAKKCVDIRITNKGKSTDYTFEEFRKILYP